MALTGQVHRLCITYTGTTRQVCEIARAGLQVQTFSRSVDSHGGSDPVKYYVPSVALRQIFPSTREECSWNVRGFFGITFVLFCDAVGSGQNYEVD